MLKQDKLTALIFRIREIFDPLHLRNTELVQISYKKLQKNNVCFRTWKF